MNFKNIFSRLSLFFISFFVVSLIWAGNSQTGTLTVNVIGIRSNDGVIRIGLYNSQQSYEQKSPSGDVAFKRAILKINSEQAVWTLQNLPYGVYAIKLFHDEDNSGQLKKTFIGRPTEGVGFSNNPQLGNHAPTFSEVQFNVYKPQTTITINMINP